MNCNDINIWLNLAAPEELTNPDNAINKHMASCSSCAKKHHLLVQAFKIIDKQKKQGLSVKQTEDIISRLKLNQQNRSFTTPFFRVNKWAAAIVILIGLSAGILAGMVFSFYTAPEISDTWSTEFSMLSDNEDYLPSIFD